MESRRIRWDDMVEELSYSGLDYVGPDARGYSPNHPNTDAGDPHKYANLCAAMDRRPLDNTFKVAIFDDNAASWTANRNLDKGLGYGYNPPFDCGDTSNYRYIWDLDLKICIQNTPDDKRYKIKNRMVMIFWSVNPPFCTNQGNGHVKAIALMIRQKFTHGPLRVQPLYCGQPVVAGPGPYLQRHERHRRGAKLVRCAGYVHDPHEFPRDQIRRVLPRFLV